MKKLSIVVMALFAMLLCAPAMAQTDVDDINKKIQAARDQQDLDKVQGNLPCMREAMDDAEYFRALGVGSNRQISMARNKALRNAKNQIRAKMSEFVDRMSSDFMSIYEGDVVDEAQSEFKETVNVVSQGVLNHAEQICEKMGRTEKGLPESYIVLQVSKKEIKKEITDSVQEKKWGVDIDAEKFQQFMDEKWEDMIEQKENAGY